ncbi:MAG: DEAD/DEAH box helicase family protein [Bacteroidota bacterium]
MSNFEFLKDEFPKLYREAAEAEKLALTSPKASAMMARSALEMCVQWLYQHDEDLEWPYDRRLSSLIHAQCFKDILRPSMFEDINLIRLTGNNAAHGRSISQKHSLPCLKNLFRLLTWVAASYSREEVDIPAFRMDLLPDGSEQRETLKELQRLQEELERRRTQEAEEQKRQEAQAAEIATLREKLAAEQKANAERRQAREKALDIETHIPRLISEAETRKLYIDVLLKDAGWDNLTEGRNLEYEVKGMPASTNPTGLGYADYVLWGKDGKPLAVIEAKKTLAASSKGRYQAKLYADCLEQMHGQRPIIFYTNGFETFIWDDTFYIDREIQGFYTQDELQLLIDRRSTRKDLRNFSVNRDIAGRTYQLEAIQRVAENFVITAQNGKLRGASRESLLVMATGSGKTRTSAAIVDMLSKCNWVKRVLFLADRNALVTQAKKAFNTHLPELSAIDLTKEKEDNSTRLVFSTYPTILNKIDQVKSGDQRMYGVGHFDLIIIDEAHRSVYQKYRAIFEYFDALLIGLTATPKKDIDRNTYGLFGIEDDNPTFAYELNEAVEQGYLVPPKAVSVPLKFQREGIKYSELSEAEQEEYEEKFGDPTTDHIPEEIGSAALNKWLFNADTVDKVLDHLMTAGIKVAGGDKLGKTIVFAKNHKHAEFIQKRFYENYREFGKEGTGTFLAVIDNYNTKAQDLLEKFCYEHEEQEPQIAVSVDMIDTGVDAPRVVNLVFFKLVKSASKFWQMIGRGTRLCPDLFGPGEDKTEFLIFDYCQNFEFFDEYPEGASARYAKPLLQQIFEAKLKVAQLIALADDTKAGDKEVRDRYLEELYQTVSTLDWERFIVRKELRYVVEFSEKSRWYDLNQSDVQEIHQHLSHLQPLGKDDDEKARRFDMVILTYQALLLTGSGNTGKYQAKVYAIAYSLEKKDNLPEVKAQLPLIKEIQTEHYWEHITIKRLETLRVALRDLVKYLRTEEQAPVYTYFQDELDYANVQEREVVTAYMSLPSYKKRVETYIRKNSHHLTIRKLHTNKSITQVELEALEEILFTDEVAGTREQFMEVYGEKPLGNFVRSIVGLDQSAVNEAFADFLQTGILRADQMTFLHTLMKYLTQHGTIDKKILFEPPFTDLHDQGIYGMFESEAEVAKVVQILDRINGNAQVA